MRAALLAAGFGAASALQLVRDATPNGDSATLNGTGVEGLEEDRATLNGTGVESLEGDNLCMMGRLAPTFFLLGTPKSGTTFFYEDFARSDQIVEYHPSKGAPEWHSKEPWVFSSGFTKSAYDRKVWLSHYPECPQDEHLVAVDCTPGYFGSKLAPFGIEKAYGDAGSNIVFMVFLREPVSRSHSHYYQYQQNGVLEGAFDGCSPQQFPPTFKKAVKTQMATTAMCNCSCDDIFEDSMYTYAFRRYFNNFDPSQFHVVPFRKAVLGEVVDYAWRILKVAKGKGEKSNLVGGDNDKNHHDYPALDEEMGAELLEQFQVYMDNNAGPVALSEMLVGSGAHLYGLEGDEGAPAIAEWLANNW